MSGTALVICGPMLKLPRVWGKSQLCFLNILCSLFTCTGCVLNPGLLVVNCKDLLSKSAQHPRLPGNVSNHSLIDPQGHASPGGKEVVKQVKSSVNVLHGV